MNIKPRPISPDKNDDLHKHLCVRCNEPYECFNPELICPKPHLCENCRKEVQECA